MIKIIFAAVFLTVVMACILVYVILSNFRYDKDLAKNLSKLTETEVAKENVPMIPAQIDNTTNYDVSGKLKDFKEEKDEFDWLRQKREKDEFGWTRKKTEEEKDEYGWTGKKAEEEKDDNEAGVELENRKQKKYWKKIFKIMR